MSDRLLIIGSGEKESIDASSGYHIMVINKEIKNYGEAKHHVSVHHMFHLSGNATSHTFLNDDLADCKWSYKNLGGTSALFAVHVALKLGYDKIALYGCPLTGSYGDKPNISVWKQFIENNDCSSVRSYSGKTMRLLGNAKGWF